jgi:protein-S-isoprenylcysteine O-methyltransferase Ste14
VTSRLPSLGPRGEGWVAAQLVLFALIGATGLAALAGRPGGPWSLAGPYPVAVLVGGGAVVVGGLVVVRAAWDLRASLSPFPRPVAGAELVDGGAFRRVRHPIYSGILLAGAGWALVAASLVTLALVVLLAVLFDAKSRREEAWLSAAFPGYETYRARTRRFVPGVY